MKKTLKKLFRKLLKGDEQYSPRRMAFLEPLEPRLLLSAASPIDAFSTVVDDLTTQPVIECQVDPGSNEYVDQSLLGIENGYFLEIETSLDISSQTNIQNLILVDTSVSDYEALLNELLTNQNDSGVFEVHFLDSQKNGVDQVNDILSQYDGLSAVHLISHGGEGQIQLGNIWLTQDNLSNYSDSISQWGDSLSQEADLLFYGCDLAADQQGQALLASLGELTGADIAASTDITGHSSLGGDWELEYSEGTIDVESLFLDSQKSDWEYILAAAPVITSDGGGDTASVNAAENQTAVTTVTASGGAAPYTYSIIGGADQSLFSIDSNTGDLTFNSAPDYETPLDSDSNNVYEVQVQVTASDLKTDSQAISVTVTDVNDFGITSDGAGATASINVPENEMAVTTVTAEYGTAPYTYSIIGGADQALFSIDSDTGILTFDSAPNYETPADSDSDNIYEVQVQVEDATAATDTQSISVNVTDVNEFVPVITSDGGGATAAINLAENQTGVTTVTATDDDGTSLTYSITGGADAALFSIHANTGVLTFDSAPDYETPNDSDTNNTYIVEVTADDGDGGTDIQTITVTVTDEGVGTVTVDTTSDVSDGDTSSIAALLADKGADGMISLREAITAANATDEGGSDRINFDISGSGPHTISLLSELPDITDVVIIDGTSEPDYAGSPVIVLDGTSAGNQASGLTLTAGSDGSTIKGLVVNKFKQQGILIDGSDNNTIIGNYIGTDATGTVDLGNSVDGIRIENGASYNIIGGSGAGEMNLISGNNDDGIELNGSGTSNNVILGNYIGTDITGTLDLGNTNNGIAIWLAASSNTIGGSGVGEGNLISGNNVEGVRILSIGTSYNVVLGNYIGTDVTGTQDLGNGASGVTIWEGATFNTIGGTEAGQGNLISGNDYGIVILDTSTGNAILGNLVYDNGSYQIDLNNDGTDSNDNRDNDTGPNNGQNYPIITSAATTGSNVTIVGTLNSNTNTDIRIEFFRSDASGYGGSLEYLGSTSVTTDGSGNASFNLNLAIAVASGQYVTAVAIVDLGGGSYGDSSEFSLNQVCIGNTAPVITSDGGGATASVNAAENQTAVTTVTATDADGSSPTYSITGGADSAWFTIDANSGVLTFDTAPDYESPADANTDNNYIVEVTADDGNGGTDVQTISVTVTNLNDNPPSITSDGGGATASVNAAENQTAVTTVTATDGDGDTPTYSITGGDDAGKFSIDTNTGVLTFDAAPDYETPTDANADNDYIVEVTATDGTNTDVQTITVTVNDVDENTQDPPASDVTASIDESGTSDLIGSGEDQTDDFTDIADDTPTYNGFNPIDKDSSAGSDYNSNSGGDDNVETETLDIVSAGTDSESEPASEASDSESDPEPITDPETSDSTDQTNTEEAASEAEGADSQPNNENVQTADRTPDTIKGPMFRISDNKSPQSQAAMNPRYRINQADPGWNQKVNDFVTEFEQENENVIKIGKFTVGSSFMAMGTISVGYITWALQGSALFTTMLSSLPTWMSFDPLPILENNPTKNKKRASEEEEDETDKKIDSILT